MNSKIELKICVLNLLLICFLYLMFGAESTKHLGGRKSYKFSQIPAFEDNSAAWNNEVWVWQKVPKSDAPQTTSGDFKDCDFSSGNDGWAVGFKSLVRWNGSNWVTNEIPGSLSILDNLNDVEVLESDNAWAVGNWGLIIHWDGEQWQDMSYSTESDLLGISFNNTSNDGFIVGGYYIEQGREERLALRWDGEQWSQTPFMEPGQETLDPTLRAVQLTSENDGWASGNGRVYRWDGKEWKLYTQTTWEEKSISFTDISKLNPNNVWSIGSVGGLSMIFHFDGTEWKEVFQTHPYQLQSIKMISPDQGWAVGVLLKSGVSENSKIFTWDGIQWSETIREETRLDTVCAFDLEHAWIFGSDQNNPVTLRLTNISETMQTPLVTPTATIGSTHTPSLLVTPSVAEARFATSESTPSQNTRPQNTERKVSPISSSWFWIGLFVIVTLILGVIRLTWKK
ncbi:MAG: hypothetical protein GYA36_19910 [Veillonellaceae bacterium]|nr:hypothetical protein [Veillonellaceae bacterium]